MTYSNFQINYSHHKTPKWRKMVDLLHAIVQTRVTTIVLLSHKLVANVLQHYELLCMLPPKRNTFFFLPWQLYSQGTEPEVVLSLNFIAVPGHALIPKANLMFLHLLIIEYMVVTKGLGKRMKVWLLVYYVWTVY